MHLMVLLGDVGEVEAFSVYFDIVLILIQDKCTVCTERTIGLEICWDARDGTPKWRGQVEAHFSLFGDSVNLNAR